MKYGFILAILASPLLALETFLPSASTIIEQSARNGSIALPTARYTATKAPNETLAGGILRRAWRVDDIENPAGLFQELLSNYERQGFREHWSCHSINCGGFDFRYGIETAAPPDFQINLDDFSYADYRKDDEIVTLLFSSFDGAVFLQQTEVTPSDATFELTKVETPNLAPSGNNRLILNSVRFDPGKTDIAAFDDDELENLVTRLRKNGEEALYLVGHSDQSGGLDVNVRISRARAQSVRQLLIAKYNISADRIHADGVGFLAPIADNTTEAGREINRRVEAVFLVN